MLDDTKTSPQGNQDPRHMPMGVLLKRFGSLTLISLLASALLPFTTQASATTDLKAYSLKISNYGGMYANSPSHKIGLPIMLIKDGYLYQRKISSVSSSKTTIEMIQLDQSIVPLLEELYAASLPTFKDFGMLPIFDQQSTEIEVSTPAGKNVTQVYLPWNSTTNFTTYLTPENIALRDRLSKALYALDDIKGRKTIYKPNFYEYHVLPWGNEVKDKDKRSAVKLKTYPASTKLDFCFTISRANLPRVVKDQNVYLLPNKKYQHALLRPILPGEKACERTGLY
ncbi:MAG: hypothetical protein ACKOW9_05350 [Candidatus Paceibacterota bacterium]